MPGESIFAKLISGEIPCQRIFENDLVFAFLDIKPLATGHTLVIPKRVVERLEDLTTEEAAELGRQVSVLAKKVMAATGTDACNILLNNGSTAGQEIPHVHYHIVPRLPRDGLGYRWNARPADPAELEKLADKIRSA